MRSIKAQRLVHYMLFSCALLEILELEIFAIGVAHHIWDAVVIAIYAYAALQISKKRSAPWIIVLLGGVAWLLDLLNLSWEGFDIESSFWVLTHAYLALILGCLLFKVTDITDIEIVDSVSLYIVVGIVFANLYGMILWHHPGALVHTGVPAGERISYDLVLYYSFITQITVGYGDMAPAHPVTRTVSVVQAIFGVMYIAILISRFVSIHSASHFSRQSSSKEPRL